MCRAVADVDAYRGRHRILVHALLLFRRLLATLFCPDSQITGHPAGAVDLAQAVKIALAGAAGVQTQGPQAGGVGVPAAQLHQLVPQPLRRPGVRRAVAGAVEHQVVPGQQHGGSAPRGPIGRVVAERRPRALAGRQQLHAGQVVPTRLGPRHHLHADVCAGIPGESPTVPASGCLHRSVDAQVAHRLAGGHVVKPGIDDVLTAQRLLDLGHAPAPGFHQGQPGDAGPGDDRDVLTHRRRCRQGPDPAG